jgi:hypothetical protein
MVTKNQYSVNLDSSNILSKGRTTRNKTNQQPRKILKDEASLQDGHSSKDVVRGQNKRHRLGIHDSEKKFKEDIEKKSW